MDKELTAGNISNCQDEQKVLVKFDEILTQWKNKSIDIFKFVPWCNSFTSMFWVDHFDRPTFNMVKMRTERQLLDSLTD